ncbi:Hypothetical protein, putative [Bodo saltans]|uniref:Uncharacterized protein n=1 Tax=Bodo saltans TaxID=75058 RepID=A0A0S4J1K2_BODSA|nr:Hypothetical protein, putative [Bodo saltans]|eukprot:CUG33206.1 Hypothetical protein, putative [Bodo saltans]
MLVIGNDTTVPTFWLHAIPTAAATSSELVNFFDSRFELCIRFSCAGVTCSSNTNPTVCSSGSSVRPGQFRFQSVVLATGSWYFSAYSLTFTPLDEVVLFPAATPLFFCANVTQPLTFRNISSVRFSPRVNRGLLYHRKTICAAVGITLDPITVHAFPVKNSSLLEQGGLVADPTILDGTAAVFRLRVLSGASQDSASVISTWNISVFVNNPAEATFRNVTISKYIPSASIVIDVVQQGVVVYNYLVLFLNLAAAPINLCSLEIPQQRNQPFLFTLGMAWGATVSVGASMPTIFVAARRSDGSYSEGLGGGDFFSPLLVSAVGYSVEGKPFPLSGGTTTPLANGVASFSSLVLAAGSASYEFMWIQFQITSGGTTVATCLSFPLKLSRSATAVRFAIDQRGESRFSVAGSLQYGTVNSALPPIRLVLQDSYFHRILPTSIKTAVVSVRSCYSDWETITSTGLSSIIPWCSNVTESVPVSLSGATSVSFSQTGIASLTNVTFSPNFVFANASTVVNVLMVISVDDAAIYFPLVLSHPSAPPLRSVVRFQPGVTASLFTANFQSTHAVLGSPLPPIILLLMFPNGTIDRRNVSLSVSVSCAGAVLRHATSYFQYGVGQVPGVVVEHSHTSVIRLSFLIYLIESSTGARVRMHKLESGAIQLVSFTKLSTADASSLPFALQFSRTRGFISYGVTKQDVLNSTILPPFEVALVRADHLLAKKKKKSSSGRSEAVDTRNVV